MPGVASQLGREAPDDDCRGNLNVREVYCLLPYTLEIEQSSTMENIIIIIIKRNLYSAFYHKSSKALNNARLK